MAKRDLDEHAITELTLYANQTSELYDFRIGIVKQIMERIAKGSYNSELGVRLWERWYTDAAKRYAKEYAIANEWTALFPVAERKEAAHHQEQDELVRIELGEYDWLFAKPNPIHHGYSQHSISENIREERHRGKSQPQSVAIALQTARDAWREKHPSGVMPSGLRKNPRKITLVAPTKTSKKQYYIVGAKLGKIVVYIGRNKVSDTHTEAHLYPTRGTVDKEVKRLREKFPEWRWSVWS